MVLNRQSNVSKHRTLKLHERLKTLHKDLKTLQSILKPYNRIKTLHRCAMGRYKISQKVLECQMQSVPRRNKKLCQLPI